MPNDLSSRQWRLDTPVVFGNPGAVLWNSEIKIDHFEFSGYAAQGNQVVIKNRVGKIVWSATGASDLEEVRSGKIGWIEGLVLDTCQGNGVVIAYIQ